MDLTLLCLLFIYFDIFDSNEDKIFWLVYILVFLQMQ
jgi:hypothetical protein